jgi:DNA-binding NarL/FixJ family response regulator
VFVVDDFEPWRRFACSALSREPELEFIGEALDGLTAVQKAQELQPDLILLDIGLPGLNGIPAARRIREFSPKSRILFVTENRAEEMVFEAFRAGGRGYIIKSDAGGELLPAIRAVLRGELFASACLGLSNKVLPSEKVRAKATDGEYSSLYSLMPKQLLRS